MNQTFNDDPNNMSSSSGDDVHNKPTLDGQDDTSTDQEENIDDYFATKKRADNAHKKLKAMAAHRAKIELLKAELNNLMQKEGVTASNLINVLQNEEF